ncbi:MAG: DUF4397 domain-containing protein [Sphingobacteriales bacterium]|nr:MAG: DUF4397 domain-containing protein [Sphingobacteriales bacterium]
MKKFLLTSIISAAAFTSFAQPAQVQIINNSPDSTIDMVDVYFNGNPQANDLMYKGATALSTISQTNTPVVISFAKHDGVYPVDTFKQITTTFTSGNKYILILNGTKDQARYSPAVPIRVDIYTGAKDVAANSQETEILFAHGSTDLPQSDFRVGAEIVDDNRSFSSFAAGYKAFPSMLPPPAQRVLRITNPSGSKTISSHNFNLMPFAGRAIVAMPTGFVNPGANRNGAPLTFIAVTSTGQVMEFVPTTSDMTRIQLIHNSADLNASLVDVYFGDSLTFANVPFRTASPFIDIPAQSNMTLGVAPANSNTVADTFFSADLYLDPEKNYIGVMSGIRSNSTGYTPMRPMTFSLKENGKEEGSNNNNVDVTVFHGSTDAPVFDIQNGNGTVIVNDLAYGQFSSYLPLPATVTSIVHLTDAAGGFLHRYSPTFTPFAGQAGVILASGFHDSTVNNNGSKFGLYFATAMGGPLMALPEAFVSVNDIAANSNIKIYPNPATDRLFIAGTQSADFTATVCDMTGKVMAQFSNDTNGVDVSRLASGMYILKVQDGANTFHQKFSKQ